MRNSELSLGVGIQIRGLTDSLQLMRHLLVFRRVIVPGLRGDFESLLGSFPLLLLCLLCLELVELLFTCLDVKLELEYLLLGSRDAGSFVLAGFVLLECMMLKRLSTVHFLVNGLSLETISGLLWVAIGTVGMCWLVWHMSHWRSSVIVWVRLVIGRCHR